ncbi:FMN-dependent NADH-azoreductase [Sphingomonas tabacisoli]|uniref:FMN dependent NADH:quinone oxidoreductase n=1 Tax=Sphingomonas tabacisoli TaxID=2249466 RepID=A0ABW4I5G1_9SPHN
MTILHIDSSVMGENSVTRIISQSAVDQLKATRPGGTVVRRDLATDPIPHFTPEAFADSTVVDEFLAAEVVVIGAPMYNFGIASQLKAWIDRIAVAGKTFRYTEQGPEGLAGGKKVVIASARGGFYGPDTAMAAFDHQENYLRNVFGFLGVTDVTFVRAEGVAMGPDARDAAVETAKAEALKLAA